MFMLHSIAMAHYISKNFMSYGIYILVLISSASAFILLHLRIEQVILLDEILNSMTNYRCNQFTKWQPNLVLLAILKRKSFYNGKSVMPLQTFLFLYKDRNKQNTGYISTYRNRLKRFFFEIPTLLFSEQEYHEWENFFF